MQLTLSAPRKTIRHYFVETQRMTDFVLPETRYALSGDVNIAYQVMGAGPLDIIVVPGVVSHIEFMHEMAGYTVWSLSDQQLTNLDFGRRRL
jgi:hypothetical protein